MDFLLVDDDKAFRDAACLLIEAEGHYAQPAASGEVAMAELNEGNFDAGLLDVSLGDENGLDLLVQLRHQAPNLPVVMLTAGGNIDTAVEAMRRGAVDFLEKPFRREHFHQMVARIGQMRRVKQSPMPLERPVPETKPQSPEMLADFTSPRMRQVMDIINRAARSSASILLLGESGTGKSALARLIHQQSHLQGKPFVTVSCPSLSRELLESELFGHVKGSFTGAVSDRWGKVKAASGGTLFLDEIGELSLEIQPKLLRLLQEREYERLGENITRQADVRIIAATNRDLRKLVAKGTFREDLYFRLNVIAVEVPPLRSRPADLERFAEHYLDYFAHQSHRDGTEFSAEALRRIREYSWPGNLRELRNSLERAVILANPDGAIGADELPSDRKTTEDSPPGHPPKLGELMTLEQLEDAHICGVLERSGSVTEAARILGIDQATIYRKRKKMQPHLDAGPESRSEISEKPA